jgi:hypothetical protein
MLIRTLGFCLLLTSICFGAPFSGVVRSGSQPIPGATVSATSNGQTLTTTTDENGQYTFADLPSGTWTIEVQMFAFNISKAEVTTTTQPATKDWTLELMARGSQRAVASAPASPPLSPGTRRQAETTATEGARPVQAGQNGPGRGPGASQSGRTAQAAPGSGRPGQAGGFRNLTLAQSANMTELSNLVSPQPDAAAQADSSESYLVSGSVSRGVQDIPQEDVFARGRMDQMRGGDNANGDGNGGIPGFASPGAGAPGGGGGPGGGGFGGGGGGFGGRGGGGGGGFAGGRGGPGGRGPGGDRSPRERLAAGPGGRNSIIGNRVNRGRSQIRGSAFLSARNSVFDARPFSLTGQNTDQASYSQYRYGLVIGGGLNIPKIIHSEKTFFFLTYNGSSARNPFDALTTVPTALQRAGDFSQSFANGPVTIFDPLTHAPFANNVIPPNRLDAAAMSLLRYFPLPNQPGIVDNFRFVTAVPQNSQNFGIRLNHTLSRKDRLDFALNLQERTGNSAQTFGFIDDTNGTGLSTSLGWTHNITTRLINSLRFSFSRNRNQTLPFFADSTNIAAALGILGTSSDPINFGPPNLGFTNFGALSDASPALRRDQTASLTEGMTFIKGQHTLTFGGEFRRVQLNSKTDQDGRGTYTFSGLLTSAFDAQGQPIPGTGYDLADYLLGDPQSSSIRYGSASNYFRNSVYNAYISDDWKARPNLTVNAGLRYEYFTPFVDKYNRLANLDVAANFTGVAVVIPGQAGPYSGVFPDGLVNPDKNLWSPRLGIAWKPIPKKQTLVRAGYGIYFNGSIYSQFPGRLASQPPFADSLSVTTSLAQPLTIENGFLNVVSKSIKNTYAIDRNYRVGYAQTWNLSLQQPLAKSLILEVSYLGTKGTRLDIQRMPNRAPPGSPLTAEQRRIIGDAVGFTFESSDGNSIYHAGNLRVTRRFAKGVSTNFTYTYAKSIDNASTFGGAGNTVAQNDLDLHAERGLSSFDQRHTASAGYVLTSPFGQNGLLHSQNSSVNRLFSDWTLSGNIMAHSGHPFTARVLGNQSNSGGTGSVGSGRADATGLAVDDGGGYFNPLAFAIPTPGHFGTAGRNTIPGPGLFSMNLSLSRSFRLGDDRRRVEFRIDSSNFTNHVNITNFGTVINANNYGIATAAGAMRSITSTVRFRF